MNQKKNFISQESKSDNFIININNNTKKENKKEIKDRCRICGGEREEHIKDEFNKELALERKKYEKDQYYEYESTNINRKER